LKLNLIWIRSTSDAEFRDAVDRYFNRIKHFLPIELTELAPEKGRQPKSDALIIHAHSAKLLSAIPPRGTVVVLDERGKSMTSLTFAAWLEREIANQPHGIHFVLGGDIGFDDSVRQKADLLLALSAMTLPHQMARVILLEQIYRACTLMRNIRYHK
jgi:23S rRNA (pseudouridine1915-N3)-methyltransferase